jgi:hypothetical protein
MVLVSRQISTEYRQAFYERTKFFLRIDSQNAFKGVPEIALSLPHTEEGLGEEESGEEGSGEEGSGEGVLSENVPRPDSIFPNFWDAPDALIASLRHCTLFIEIGDIACHPASTNGLSQCLPSYASKRHKQINHFLLASQPATAEARTAWDTAFNKAIKDAVRNLLEGMQQLRSVQLVWETSLATGQTGCPADDVWSYAALGAPLVEMLQERRILRKFQVKVGDKYEDVDMRGERGEGGEWKVGAYEGHYS